MIRTVVIASAALLLTAPSASPQGPKTVPAFGVDAHGDPLPTGALARLGTVRLRHRGSPPNNGWDCAVYQLAFSPDGKWLASASHDRTVRLWDTTNGRQVQQWPDAQAVHAIAFSPDSALLAWGGASKDIYIYNLKNGKRAQRLDGHKGTVHGLAFSPDGKVLASGSLDKTLRLWETATGLEIRRLRDHDDGIFWVAFANEGKTVVSAGHDGAVLFRETASGKEVERYQAQPRTLRAVALGPDSKTLALASTNQTCRLWDAGTGRGIHDLPVERSSDSGPHCLAFSPDGKHLAGASNTGYRPDIWIWDTATGKPVQKWRGTMAQALAFSPDGKTLAVADARNAIRLWDAATGKERVLAPGHIGRLNALAFSPDGRLIATAGHVETLRLWDAASGRQLHEWDIHDQQVYSLAFSPDSKALIVASDNTRYVLWDTATGKKIRTMEAKRLNPVIRPPYALVIAPDGNTLWSADEFLRLFDLATGKHLRDIKGFWTNDLAFSPDGKRVALACEDSLRILEAATGKEIRRFGPATIPTRYTRIVWDALGRTLIAGNHQGTVSRWDPDTGKPLSSLGPGFVQHGLALSRDGRFVALSPDRGWDDATVQFAVPIVLWELATGEKIGQLVGHTALTAPLAFAPDGRRLLSGSSDTTALVWDVTGRLRDGQLRREAFSPKQLEALWHSLGLKDGEAAYRAVWALAAEPEGCVPLLANRLQGNGADEKRLARWLADLADDDARVRQTAADRVLLVGGSAYPFLKRALAGDLPKQVRARVEPLLAAVAPAYQEVHRRHHRAIFVLEQIGTPQAEEVLRRLARGPAEDHLTQESTLALQRLKRKVSGNR